MKTLCMMLLVTVTMLFAGCRSLPSEGCLIGGTVDETKVYLDRYDNVLLVCVTKDRVSPSEHPARSFRHFSGTVVRVYKGEWTVSEAVSWRHELDERIPLESNKHTGRLYFVFTDSHTDKEIFLDTGDWPRWGQNLAQQIEAALK